MAITASGLFGLSLEKALIDTLADSWEAEDNNIALVSDSATPNFDTMDFWNDLSANEVTGTNWAAGGVALTGTELTISSGTLVHDATDVSVASTTITSAMCSVFYRTTGNSATAELLDLHDFVTAVSTSTGTFGIQWHATGRDIFDYTP
jgi:hypothetical protein